MFPNYTIITPSWSFDIHPGENNNNATAVFSGTIQHAMIQMEEAYPGWRKELDSHIINETISTHRKRYDWKDYWQQPGRPLDCDRDEATESSEDHWKWAKTDAIHEGIKYLDHLNLKDVQVDKGPSCGRVSCSYDSAIFACNGDPDPVKLMNWSRVGDAAWLIMSTCHFDVPYPRMYCKGEATHGWSDHRADWSVIVRGLKKGHELIGSDHC